jgi:small nuclear ribonucleoprotein (snRNP)-like protein
MTDLFYSKTSKQLLELLGHYTVVTLKNQKSVNGYLYTIDPQSRNVVLFDIKDQRVLVAMDSSIQDLNSNKRKIAYSSSFVYLFIFLYFS